jgi:hopene-associated glycosyltransferase HpnB
MLLLGLAVLAVLAWLYLLLLHGRFWRADQRLDAPPASADLSWPAVVAVIPARDEAAVIGASIASHLRSRYPGAFHVVLVDDASTDGTAEVARQAAAAAGRAERLTVTSAPPLPAGWSGKLWAVHHGLTVARQVAPDARYVLLTDADIVHGPDTLTQLVAKAQNEQRALVSLLARLDDRGPWAGLLIPAFVFFFQKLYPFPRVNDPRGATAGAAGGCMLIERAALEAAGGIPAVRHELIDDCAIARRIKGRPPRRAIWLGLSREVVSLRDNRRLADIWDMVARTAYTQLRYSPALLLGTVAGLALLYLLGPALALAWPAHGQAAVGLLGLAAWALMTLAYAPTLTLYGRPWWQGIALPLAALLYALMTLASAWRHWRGRGGRWKGRSYSGADLRQA